MVVEASELLLEGEDFAKLIFLEEKPFHSAI
jgi:hypothetical protein